MEGFKLQRGMSSQESIILVVGACGLDRLLAVPAYPIPDSKVRTTTYHEIGGGNAANTATAMARLTSASFCASQNFRVRLCSKVGDDFIAKQVMDELQADGVDLSSPLFCVGEPGTTTGFTTIIVSENDSTRTCLHTPGTCGELTLQDLQKVDMDTVFQEVMHLHSDARHTTVALALAKEARKRGISVSLDVEKDRKTEALDAFLEIATTIFTNAQQLEAYLSRLTQEKEKLLGKSPLPDPTIVTRGCYLNEAHAGLFLKLSRPSTFFSRWFEQRSKETVITRGAQGVVHVYCESVVSTENSSPTHRVEIAASDKAVHTVSLRQVFSDLSIDGATRCVSAAYRIRTVGVMSDARIVDTTGAGDAFIGAFLLARLVPSLSSEVQMCLQFGSWVAGKKLAGPGARSSLPRSLDVDEILGTDVESIRRSLANKVGGFRFPSSSPL